MSIDMDAASLNYCTPKFPGVLFEAAASADLGPSKEERHLLPGTSARPGDVTIHRWENGKDGAIDVTVASPLCSSQLVRLWRKPVREK